MLGTLFVLTVVQENGTMEPGIRKGDRLVVSPFPFGARVPAFSFRLPGPETPKRGDLVIVERAPLNSSEFVRFSDSLIRFFSGQRASLSGPGVSRRLLKRVIGVPGDSVAMVDHVMRVKPKGDPYGLTEFELTTHPYDITVPQLPDGWDTALPFSGTLGTVILGPEEYFVISDDRAGYNDSRVWGPVPIDAIIGKVLFRYWPFSRFGRP